VKELFDDFRRGVSFLTIFPFGNDLPSDPASLGRSMALFPAVGLSMGIGLVVVNALLTPFIPRPVLDCLLVLIMIVATGALHLDGIADLIDGLAGGKDREGVLRIMKDSHVGAIGVVGLVMVLLLKYLSLYNVPLEEKSAALLIVPAAGRWVQVVLAAFCRYIRPEGGTGTAFVDHAGEREFLVGSAITLVAALILFGLKGFALIFFLAVAAAAMIRYFERRLGGVTGDVLGASSELMEVIALIVLLALY